MIDGRPMRRLLKPAIFATCLAPLALLAYRAVTGDLGTNPEETLNRFTGDWTLRFLLIALAVTPLRRLTGWAQIGRLRRMLGLFAFAYALVHFLTWIWVGQQFDPGAIVRDVIKRPFITVGFAALLMLVPLAVTSTDAMVRRLRGRNWRALHRLVYVIAVCGVVHFLWLVKSDIREPLLYGAILALLLGMRAWWALRRTATPAGAETTPS
jgi:methionine sulfoxide reductase heme-binding subunit